MPDLRGLRRLQWLICNDIFRYFMLRLCTIYLQTCWLLSASSRFIIHSLFDAKTVPCCKLFPRDSMLFTLLAWRQPYADWPMMRSSTSAISREWRQPYADWPMMGHRHSVALIGLGIYASRKQVLIWALFSNILFQTEAPNYSLGDPGFYSEI